MESVKVPRSGKELRTLLARISALRKSYSAAKAERDAEVAAVDARFRDRLTLDGTPIPEVLKAMEQAALQFADRYRQATFQSERELQVDELCLQLFQSPGAMEYPDGRAAAADRIAQRIGLKATVQTLLESKLDGIPLSALLQVTWDINASGLLKSCRDASISNEQLLPWGVQFVKPERVKFRD